MEKNLKIVRNQLIAGNQAWLSKLYAESKPYCVNFLIRTKHCNHQDAEDIFTEAILVIRRRIMNGSMSHLENIKTFLVGVCTNIEKEYTYKKIRVNSREQKVKELFYDLDYTVPLDTAEEQNLRKRMCDKAMSSLGEKCQSILRLYHYEGLTMEEIAKYNGFASANVAKTMKSRCLKKLISGIEQIKQINKL